MASEIALLVMTDGRTEYIKQTILSAKCMLNGPITEYWMHDDSGDEGHRQWLRSQFPAFTHIGTGPRRGFGGAYNFAWKTLAIRSKTSFIFGLEDDFTFNWEVPLEAMAQVLVKNPHVYQMALRRQAWNSEEIKAGGVIERWPDDFEEIEQDGLVWLEHRRWYTTNPNLYRRSLLEREWPTDKDAEGHFGIKLFLDPLAKCGYWGRKIDAPWVNHIGIERTRNGWY